MRRAPLGVLLLPVLLGAAIACNEIESRRRSTAPLNASAEFPCERYAETTTPAEPSEGRCIVRGSAVPYDYVILVNVPETSLYAAGHTFVLGSKDKDITRVGPMSRAKLPVFGNVAAAYTVKGNVSQEVASRFPTPPTGLPLVDGQSIPVRASYTPVGRDDTTTYDAALPLDVLFASSRFDEAATPPISYLRSLPAGKWRRSFEPEPPYDAFFPPHIADVQVKRIGDQADFVEITALDDPGGVSRDATVKRDEGLDDWTVFLRDQQSGRRISTLRTLCPKDAPVCSATITTECCSSAHNEALTRLDTVGRGTSLEGVDAVVSPPSGWIGVPSLVTPLIQGSGISNLAYPEIRQPIALEGIVASSGDAGTFLGVAAHVTFVSEKITLPSGTPQSLLQYTTTLSTDARGRFSTVVPPGEYRVTIEPLEGTGFATTRKQVVIEQDPNTRGRAAINLTVARRTRVRGMAMLTDGRPLANADVLAIAEPVEDVPTQAPPRPGRTRVLADGTFSFELDPGPYVVTVIPEDGTGFPRIVRRTTIPADQVDIGIVRVPPPIALNLEIVEPTTLVRPIPRANVRIFAAPDGAVPATPLLEIGSGMTDGAGKVEILLAQQPK